MHQNVPQRNQAFQFLAFDDGEMAESEFAHDEQALFDAFIGGDSARVRGHDFGNGGGAGRAADGDNAVHNVAFGEDPSEISVAKNRKCADIVLQHVARGLKHGAVGVDGIESAVFYQLAESSHRLVLGEGESQDAAGLNGRHEVSGQYCTTGSGRESRVFGQGRAGKWTVAEIEAGAPGQRDVASNVSTTGQSFLRIRAATIIKET